MSQLLHTSTLRGHLFTRDTNSYFRAWGITGINTSDTPFNLLMVKSTAFPGQSWNAPAQPGDNNVTEDHINYQWLNSNFFDTFIPSLSTPGFIASYAWTYANDEHWANRLYLRVYDESQGIHSAEIMMIDMDLRVEDVNPGGPVPTINKMPEDYVKMVVYRAQQGTLQQVNEAGMIVEVWAGVPDGVPDGGYTYSPELDVDPPDESPPSVQNFDNENLDITHNKKILFDRPNVGNISVYNFPEDVLDYDYNQSTGLPKYNDKFQGKDLYTKSVGDVVNDAIIEKNLKFEGASFIQIRNIFIQNTGVDGTTINNNIQAWIFSEAAYGGDPTQEGYSTIWSKLKTEYKIFDESPGSKSQGSNIGNLTSLESEPLLSNFSNGSIPSLGPTTNFELTDDGGVTAFELSDIPETTLTTVFNEVQYNPIYIVVYSQGDKKVSWPINSDSRAKKLSIFKINNGDLFNIEGDGSSGTVYQADLVSTRIEKTSGGGSSWSAQQSAWRVSELSISINTAGGQVNAFSDAGNYREQISSTLPRIPLSTSTFDSFLWLAFVHPRNELNNSTSAGDTPQLERHPDFIPFTSFGYSQYNELGEDFYDLQSYNYDLDLVPLTSTPLNVSFQIDIKDLNGDDIPPYVSNLGEGIQLYYYFVIDWDDKDDEIKSIDDYLDRKPVNEYDYLNKQNENLYILKKINYSEDSNDGLLSNVYTTPGIKTIKFIMFSVYDGDGSNPYSPDFEVGRWKLCTSRIYLDIPLNQYPDFSDVGGSDYVTLPWPYTTPIIGGVSQDSKYKISVQDTLSGGKIGDTDIIDEMLLVGDLENDEMGKNIEQMDLEQVRYFNTGSYNMNTLLNIPYESETTVRVYNIDDTHLQTLEGYSGQGMSNIELGYLYPGQWINYGRPDIAAHIQTLDENVPINQQIRGGGNIGTGGNQVMGGGGGIFDAGNIIGIEGEPTSFIQQDIAPGEIAGGVDEYPDPPELQIVSPVGNEKYQAFNSSLGYIDIVWYRKYFDNDASFNIQLLKKEIDGTLSFVSLIVANTQGSPAGPFKRKFRAYLGDIFNEGGTIFNPPSGNNYTIGIFRNTTFEYKNISAYMGMDVTTDFDNYDINDITTFRVVDPLEESPLVYSENVNLTGGDVIDNLQPELLITQRPLETFANPDYEEVTETIFIPYMDILGSLTETNGFWDGITNKFPEESSVGQIFITENQDNDLKESCKLELNVGEKSNKTIYDSSGNSNKGMLIGDYRIKKNRKNQPMKRDSFIKTPDKAGNTEGAL
tara:strand:- start:2340 stop:6128 length:3789 start_codon:yes stop_codon:yes gene_type:complete